MPDTAPALVAQRVAPPPVPQRAAEPEPKRPAEQGGIYTRFRELTGGPGAAPPPPDRLTPLIARPELAHAANNLQAARVVSAMQQRYGNRYVQTVMAGHAPEGGLGAHAGGQALATGTRLEAAPAASTVSAAAVTTSRDIYFSQGTYNPASGASRGLPAAEAAPVASQNRAPAAAPAPARTASQGAAAPFRGAQGASAAVTGAPARAPGAAPAGQAHPQRSAAAAGGSAETSVAAEAGSGSQGKAPAHPADDPAHQAIVQQVRAKASQQKTPPPVRVATPEARRDSTAKDQVSHSKAAETELAGRLPPLQAQDEAEMEAHLGEIDRQGKGLPPFTVDGVVKLFEATITELANKRPDSKDQDTDEKRDELARDRDEAKKQLAQQSRAPADALQTEAKKDQAAYEGKVAPGAEVEKIQADPHGPAPAIAGVGAAAPKPRADSEVSLDDKSRELDDALTNHSVGGQTIDVKEESLALPQSGEPSFDDAATAKHEAQDEIAKATPRYREQEQRVITSSQANLRSLVGSGLAGVNSLRRDKFGGVATNQKHAATEIESKKAEALASFKRIYDATKKQVDLILKELDNIGDDFETIIKKEDESIQDDVRTHLEYVYPPHFYNYSDFVPDHRSEVVAEFRRLGGDESGGYRSLGLWDQAVDNVKEKNVLWYYGVAKSRFKDGVLKAVREQIAPKVVSVLERARAAIATGKSQTDGVYNALDPQVKAQVKMAYEGVLGQYGQLEETVQDKQKEVVNDMARAYNTAYGKLDAEFEAIKKDVLSSWWEKAWNKIKAVVNAIIEFAQRIMSLLGRLVHLAGDIITSPRAFFRNLGEGISQGFSNFAEHIDQFLITAFFDWLRGASGVPFRIPDEFGPAGFFDLFTQLLGLSTETIWQRMEVVYNKTIADAFRKGEAFVHKGLEVFRLVRDKGLAGLWEHIRESVGDILSDILDQIKDAVLNAAIKKVLIEIGKLLIPGGGFIAIAEKVFRLLQFIVEARNRILDLIESFVDGAEMAVRGDIGGIANRVTGALTKFITVAIDFLVTFFGLRSLADAAQRLIDRARKPLLAGIDWVLNKFKGLVNAVFGRGERAVATTRAEEPAEEHEAAKMQNPADAQMEADLESGTAEADALLSVAEPDLAHIEGQLPVIRSKYKLTVLTLVVDAESGDEETVHIHGEVNPKKNKRKHKVKGGGPKDLVSEQDLSFDRPSFRRSVKKELRRAYIAQTGQKGIFAGAGGELRGNKWARRHLVSWGDLKQHYIKVFANKTVQQCADILKKAGTPDTKVERRAVVAAIKARARDAFNDEQNLFIGLSKENSKLQEILDVAHPDLLDAQGRTVEGIVDQKIAEFILTHTISGYTFSLTTGKETVIDWEVEYE
jgi:hypothetical protein